MGLNSLIFLSGGTGTPKMLLGFKKEDNITVIANTADDWEYYGAYVSPDVDSVIYTLAGMIHHEKFWGIRGDSFNVINQLKIMEEDVWFNLGDKDFAIALYRKKMINNGYNLTQITQRLVEILNCKYCILPMTNEFVSTFIKTKEHNWLHFQEYWVKYRGILNPERIEFRGIKEAHVTKEVRDKVIKADKIIIGPSNPISSIEPILAIPGMRELIKKSKATKIIISPFIDDVPVSGPAKIFLKSRGYKDVSLQTIIDYYEDLADVIIFDTKDQTKMFNSRNIELRFTNILLDTPEKRIDIANYVKNI